MNSKNLKNQVPYILAYLVALVLLGYLGFEISTVLINHDSSLLLYYSQLITQKGFIPYRDFFGENTPATYIIYSLIYILGSGKDLLFRAIDFSLIAACVYFSFAWFKVNQQENNLLTSNQTRPQQPLFNTNSIYFFSSLIVITTPLLALSIKEALQREFLIFFVLWFMLYISQRDFKFNSLLLVLAAAFLISLKPHAFLLIPIPFIINRDFNIKKIIFICFSAVIMAATINFIILETWGVTPLFIEIATTYWPLYKNMSIAWPTTQILGLVSWPSFGWSQIPTFISLIGLITIVSTKNKPLLLAFAIATLYFVVPLKWHTHHQYPLLFVSQISIISILSLSSKLKSLAYCLLLLGVLFGWTLLSPVYQYSKSLNQNITEISQSIQSKAPNKNNIRIQTLTWVGPSLEITRLTSAHPGSYCIMSYMLHHNTSSPFIQNLRSRCLEDMKQDNPHWIFHSPFASLIREPIESKNFTEMDDFIKHNYDLYTMMGSVRVYSHKTMKLNPIK